MRAIANNNHSTQARRLPGRLIPINKSFAETARWKRCVPSARKTLTGARLPKWQDDAPPHFGVTGGDDSILSIRVRRLRRA
jgi:hypothetical protein